MAVTNELPLRSGNGLERRCHDDLGGTPFRARQLRGTICDDTVHILRLIAKEVGRKRGPRSSRHRFGGRRVAPRTMRERRPRSRRSPRGCAPRRSPNGVPVRLDEPRIARRECPRYQLDSTPLPISTPAHDVAIPFLRGALMKRDAISLLSILTCAVLIGCASGAAETTAAPELERHYFTTSDGWNLHYAKLGDAGSPVILIHGSGGAAQVWLDNGIADELARNHVVIAADMRGHGRSEGPRDGDMPLDVIELMDHLGIEKAHIHGFSMGGSIVAQLMARAPERIITAAFGGSGVRETGEWLAYVPPDAEGVGSHAEQARQMYRERQQSARTEFGNSEAELQRIAAMEAGEWTAPERPGPGPATLDLTSIAFPILAIVGEYDGHKSRTHRLWREARNFQSIMLPERGHLDSYYPGVIHEDYLYGLSTFIDSHDERFAR
jgi:pimeloyl-ACP methyl ester carboxylesterase